MKKLSVSVLMVLALASCAKKDPAAPGGSAGSGTVTGSDMGSPPKGSAEPTGSAAMAGSATLRTSVGRRFD